MHKRVGNISVDRMTRSDWVKILLHCNDSVTQEITLRSREELSDLRYALVRIEMAWASEQQGEDKP